MYLSTSIAPQAFSPSPDAGRRTSTMHYSRFVLRSMRPLRVDTGAARRHRRRDFRSRSAQAEQQLGRSSASQSGSGWAKWLISAAGGVFGLGSVAYAFQSKKEQSLEAFSHQHYEHSKASHPWIQAIAEEDGTQLVLTAEALMKADHPFLEDDHMFSAFVGKGIVDDLHGFYNPKEKKFSTIISLGREVCGFPRVVHGGLTAAIIDESFGGLLFALKQQKALNFWGPAYTVSLEVQYKSKIAAGSTVLCTTEVESMEGRKLWMRATVSDGPDGKVFATARALFVAPKPQKLAKDVAQYLWRRVFPID